MMRYALGLPAFRPAETHRSCEAAIAFFEQRIRDLEGEAEACRVAIAELRRHLEENRPLMG